jgi:hypothetical protein
MIVKHKVGVTVDNETAGINLGSSRANTVYLRKENGGVHNNPRAQETLNVRTKDTARKEAERCLDPINNDRMSGVVSTLEADDPISPFGKYIDDLSLTLIAPLSANDNNA